MRWPRGPLENRFLACSQPRCPAPGHPAAVVTAKASAMETIVQKARSRLPGESVFSSFSAALRLPCYSVVLGVGSRWAPDRSFCRETRDAAPFPRQEAGPAGTRAPLPSAGPPASSPLLPKIASPGPAGRERGGRGCPRWASELARASLCKQPSVCVPGPARALPARPAGPPSRCGSRRFWGRKTETSPVFSRLPGF